MATNILQLKYQSGPIFLFDPTPLASKLPAAGSNKKTRLFRGVFSTVEYLWELRDYVRLRLRFPCLEELLKVQTT